MHLVGQNISRSKQECQAVSSPKPVFTIDIRKEIFPYFPSILNNTNHCVRESINQSLKKVKILDFLRNVVVSETVLHFRRVKHILSMMIF